MSEDQFEEENDAFVADVDEFEQALTAVSFDEMHLDEVKHLLWKLEYSDRKHQSLTTTRTNEECFEMQKEIRDLRNLSVTASGH
eukprot:12402773-Karenia_brevis.AAC.1